MAPCADVHAEAVIEHAGLHCVPGRPQGLGALCLARRARCGCTLHLHHLLHLRRPLDERLPAEEILAWPHSGPDAGHDRLRRVIALVPIEVPAHSILARLVISISTSM